MKKTNKDVDENIQKILDEHNQGVKLDLGCGENKNEGFVGIDNRELKGVDIVHDLEEFPYPLPDRCASLAVASHVVEHINPHKGTFIEFMNEVWRLLMKDGEFMIATPMAGTSPFYQDPTHCYSEDTEVLTEYGFKLIKDVEIGENVFTLNPDTFGIEKSRCQNLINEDYSGKMMHFENKRTDMLVTSNHSMFVSSSGGGTRESKRWSLKRADDFIGVSRKSRIGLASMTNYGDGEYDKYIEVPRVKRGGNNAGKKMPVKFIAKDFMRFMGWYLSEGCVYENKNTRNTEVIIYQSRDKNKENYNEIVELIARMGFTPQLKDDYVKFSSKDLFFYLKALGFSNSKYIPQELKEKDRELLQEMLDTLIKGDGRNNNKGYEYATISKRLADDIQEIALKCGYRSSVRVEKRSPKAIIMGILRNQSEKMYWVGINNDRIFYYPEAKEVDYNGKIVCVQAEKNHIILIRRNGKVAWSGNCNPCNEITWDYFDPIGGFTGGQLYGIYKPNPWKIKFTNWHENGNLEVALIKREWDKSYK